MTSASGTEEATAPALECVDLTYAYGDAEMRFDLSVTAGEWLAVIGPSGAGKSTLLDLAAGFLEPTSGEIRMFGRDVASLAPAERPLSMVFQENNLFSHLTAFRNVALGIAPRLRVSPAQREAVDEALSDVGLAGYGKRLPSQMSGGERQRVALARAFVRDRPLILLDEPFAALGPALRQDMLALLARLRRRQGRTATVVMVTHHPEDAAAHADRVAYLENGAVAAIGEAREILSARTDERVARYLGIGRPDDRPADRA